MQRNGIANNDEKFIAFLFRVECLIMSVELLLNLKLLSAFLEKVLGIFYDKFKLSL